MTKYILVGGYPAKTQISGKVFCEELVKSLGEPVRILDCFFARPLETWGGVFAKDKIYFADNLPKTKVELILADSNRFVEQVHSADVIYFRGGRTQQLMNMLRNSIGWEKELDGKTIAGTSAGANFLAKYYYSLDNLEIHEGLGILSIKVLVHFRSDYNAPHIDWDRAISELKAYKEELPLLTLKEGQFEVMTT